MKGRNFIYSFLRQNTVRQTKIHVLLNVPLMLYYQDLFWGYLRVWDGVLTLTTLCDPENSMLREDTSVHTGLSWASMVCIFSKFSKHHTWNVNTFNLMFFRIYHFVAVVQPNYEKNL